MPIEAKPWNKKQLPKRVLVIRLQAMGDVVITLPYLQYLRNSLPSSTRIDFLTRKETAGIPQHILLFNKVITISGRRNAKLQLLYTLFLLPKLLFQRYDIVIDLQNNELSRLVRKAIAPAAWSEFDRYSPISAGERNRLTIEAVGLGKNALCTSFQLTGTHKGITILKEHGWNGSDKLVVLNPAGFFETRNWPLQSYAAFSALFLERFPNTCFVVLGISLIAGKAAYFKHELGDRLINLVSKTLPAEAFAVLQQATLVLSEDSGLMHMSWVSGIPTITLFGGTRSDWSRPLGEHSFFFDSSDLPCGNCMQETCRFGDTHCLTRYTPAQVFAKAMELLPKNKQTSVV